jgi:GT2 family glycosyltransferase
MNSGSPRLSIVIPVYNGSDTLNRCLSALAASVVQDFETVVVDDGSSDDSAAVAGRFGVRLVRLERNSGPAAARNAGVAVSAAPLLFFLDDDVIIPPSFLGRALSAIEERPEFSALFCSFGRETVPEDACSRHKNLVHHWTHQTASVEAATFCGGFGLIRREAFLAIGGFDPWQRFLEDIDLGYRLHRMGHRIFLAKDLQAIHAKAYTLGSLLRSDLFERALPWTRLMLKHRIFRCDLNTRVHNVLSVAAACLLPVSVALDVHLRLAAGLVLLFLWLNRRFLALGSRQYGPAFAVRSALLCWLSCVASAVGVFLGVAGWVRRLPYRKTARSGGSDASCWAATAR